MTTRMLEARQRAADPVAASARAPAIRAPLHPVAAAVPS